MSCTTTAVLAGEGGLRTSVVVTDARDASASSRDEDLIAAEDDMDFVIVPEVQKSKSAASLSPNGFEIPVTRRFKKKPAFGQMSRRCFTRPEFVKRSCVIVLLRISV